MGTKTSVAERCAAQSREIEETRGRIASTAQSLQNHLKPRALFRPVQARLRRTLGEGGEKILDSFRENPIPLAVTAIGLGWLILRDLRKEQGDGGEGLERAKETAGEAAHKVRAAAAAVPRKLRQGVKKTSDWFSRTLEENPLALAVGILGVGLAAGLSFPTTAKEEETAGKVGEKAAEANLEKGMEALEIVEDLPSVSPQGLPPGPQSGE